ncbi:putative uncharacterized protein DDB_G0291608 [Eriocheir sinensis]|uniref:putative uncharacterized protein DDB_G0291608 n=1 Tax=Eriocheir sinensis TaxID=95602 RepID=UPI0021CA0F18|nr:putative uncharacterized protein DDB_G0291608 [Eriocheir sinensis]
MNRLNRVDPSSKSPNDDLDFGPETFNSRVFASSCSTSRAITRASSDSPRATRKPYLYHTTYSHMPAKSQPHHSYTKATSLPHYSHMPAKSQPHHSYTKATSLPHYSHMPAKSQPHHSYTKATSLPHYSHMPAKSQPHHSYTKPTSLPHYTHMPAKS